MTLAQLKKWVRSENCTFWPVGTWIISSIATCDGKFVNLFASESEKAFIGNKRESVKKNKIALPKFSSQRCLARLFVTLKVLNPIGTSLGRIKSGIFAEDNDSPNIVILFKFCSPMLWALAVFKRGDWEGCALITSAMTRSIAMQSMPPKIKETCLGIPPEGPGFSLAIMASTMGKVGLTALEIESSISANH